MFRAPPPGSTSALVEVAIQADRAKQQRGRVPASQAIQRVCASVAEGQESVVANLDHLAHLPERFDRQMRAALLVIPLTRPGSVVINSGS